MLPQITQFLNHLHNIGVTDYDERQQLIQFAFPDIHIATIPVTNLYEFNYIGDILNGLYERIIEDEYDIEREDVKVPLSEIGINNLKYEDYDSLKHNKCELCSICQSNFENNKKITILPCDHYFHNECIGPWFKEYHHICPICRKDVNE